MRILLASSEFHPYSKTGGLADMIAALAKALAQAGHHVGVVTPLYRGIRQRLETISRLDWHMRLPLGSTWEEASVWTFQPRPNLTLYFVDHAGFYDREGLYGMKQDYPDNARRFIFLSKAVVHLARYLPWQPELVHVHDWQVALVPLLILHQRVAEGWGTAPPSCLTIHNLAFQGVCAPSEFPLTNLPQTYFNPSSLEFYGWMNLLKAGIVHADYLTTVSPRYAREIMTADFGCSLDGILRQRQDRLLGILNGVDYEEWNTTHNRFLKEPYDSNHLANKTANKLAIQSECGLPVRPSAPLFANISRLTTQKGIDILCGAMEQMIATGLQYLQLGNGEPRFERALKDLARRYPDNARVRIGFDLSLAHRIEAGADFFLMPSQFEPCGLNQMYSLRYGTIPIVRITGGLDDSVIDATENASLANGIKFQAYDDLALAKAIRKALELYQHPPLLDRYRRNGMRMDFSWEQTCQRYVALYRRLTGQDSGTVDAPQEAPRPTKPEPPRELGRRVQGPRKAKATALPKAATRGLRNRSKGRKRRG